MWHASRVKVALVWLLSLVVRGWCRTLRFEMTPEDRATARHDGPAVILLWHNRLFAVPWAVRTLRCRHPVFGLVSASRDGAYLAAFFRFVGIRTVRGSSSRLGREALHKLIAVARAGNDIAITPDGPRGPVYSMHAGALLAARRTGLPLLLFGFRYASAWQLRSWDRFLIPLPFSRVRVCLELIPLARVAHGHDALEHVRGRLLELNEVGAAAAQPADSRSPA